VASSPGPAKTCPSQYAGLYGVRGTSTGAAVTGSAVQNAEPGATGRSTPVTVSVTGVLTTVAAMREPGWSRNRAAVAWVTATSRLAPRGAVVTPNCDPAVRGPGLSVAVRG